MKALGQLISGDDGCGVPPVPIPNTAVKPTYAESTWLEAAWEDRELPVRLTLMRCMSVFSCLKDGEGF